MGKINEMKRRKRSQEEAENYKNGTVGEGERKKHEAYRREMNRGAKTNGKENGKEDGKETGRIK